MENAPAIKNMMVESAIVVKMNFMNIPVAIIVDVLQNIPQIQQIFAIKKMANAPAIKNMMVEPAIVVKMNSMNIPVVIVVDALKVIP